MNNVRTSESHPIRVDSVQPLGGWGEIGLSFCPGKTQSDALTGNWKRDLKSDLERIRAWGASTIVTLIEAHEFEELQVTDLPHQVTNFGMAWVHLPIKDRHVPNAVFEQNWRIKGQEIIHQLALGEKVFVHCKGGLGRAGTITACLLIESGIPAKEAIAHVRAARRHTIETLGQEEYVLAYVPIQGQT